MENGQVETPHDSSFWAKAKERLTHVEVESDEESTPADEFSTTDTTCVSQLKITRKSRPFLLPVVAALVVVLASLAAFVSIPALRYALTGGLPTRNVAFIGNSLIYFYDLPRSIETFSGGRIRQNSCLAGAGSLENMVNKQNGMWNRWRTDAAMLYQTDDDYVDNGSFSDNIVWDFGACSMEMLMFGHNVDQAQADYNEWWEYRKEERIEDDDGWTESGEGDRDVRLTNPCMQSQAYLNFLASLPLSDVRRSVPEGGWDFLVLDDRTAGPRIQENRDVGLAALEETFLPMIQESSATTIFLVTPAYWTHRDQDDDSNENTLEKIPFWTVETYEGYKQYANYLRRALPHTQRPRLVNMGAAFLVVFEENMKLWYNLFWQDNKHQSPHGAFLQNCLLHHTIYGVLPRRSIVIQDDMSSLWDDARTLMYPRDATVPFPTRSEAEYLYDVCRRVVNGYLPPSFKQEMKTHGLSMY
jgi:hypothetical protein